jgi:cystathionine beta-lyase/cystathionine gamma-synthase
VTVAAIADRQHPPGAPRDLLEVALADVRDDFAELLFLFRCAQAALDDAQRELSAARLHAPTRAFLSEELAAACRRYAATSRSLLRLRERAKRGAPSRSLLDALTAEKAFLRDLLRTEQALLAALVSAADWQSPSFLHSLAPAAGRQEGQILAHWNDYKRDRHLDAERYERLYLEQMVDGRGGLRALLTSCGMAAFTTILSFLSLEGRLEGPVFAGAGLYHESKLLLARTLRDRVSFHDEGDTPGFLRAVDELQPSAIFLDSLSNTTRMPVPELRPLIERLRGRECYLVLDNTGLSAACQPFALAGDSVHLLVFESLLKYAQLGLDRTNAGVIVAREDDAALLQDYREHLGTNIADVAVHALPRPKRTVLERRLARLERNALFLAARLEERCGDSVEIVHPGLPSHPSARVAAALPFRGACFSIIFHRHEPDLARERALVEATVAEAAKRDVALLAGSSFGFDTTRIYLTAARAECGEPFIRIAAGTEHRLALEPLAEALEAAIKAAS